MSQLAKPIHNKLLRINSGSRSANSASTSDFTVNYPNVQVLAKIVSIVVKHVSFPNVFYNINSSNNEFKYTVNASPVQTITVPEGEYTLAQLISYIEGIWGAGIAGTITQDPQTFKLTFASDYSIVLIESSLLPVLGVPTGGIGEPSPYTAPFTPQLQGVQHVHIASKVLSKGNNFIEANTRQEVPIVAMIPNDVPFGAVKHYETKHEQLDVINYESEVNLQSIDIKLFDGKGNLLDLQGEDCTIILKVYYRI